MKSILAAFGQPEDEDIERKILAKAIEFAQKREEGKVGGKVENLVKANLGGEVRHITGLYAAGDPSEWNLDQLILDVAVFIGLSMQEGEELRAELIYFHSDRGVENRLKQLFWAALERKDQQFGSAFPNLQRALYLNSIDILWQDHLNAMNDLRTGVGLSSYTQTDPLVVYKAEGYRLFQYLVKLIKGQTSRILF